eukprot:8664956-Lingulodinium_polyedra.AAC.1
MECARARSVSRCGGKRSINRAPPHRLANRTRAPCEQVFAWSARACDSRAVAAPDGRVDRFI